MKNSITEKRNGRNALAGAHARAQPHGVDLNLSLSRDWPSGHIPYPEPEAGIELAARSLARRSPEPAAGLAPIWRVLADGLINAAEQQPRESEAARFLREAAANLLDADHAFELETILQDKTH